MGRKFEVRKAAMAKTSLQKAKLYSRYGKEIYMAAKQGGSNPESNLTLKKLMEKAKSEQVPSDVIKRNIDKAENATGEDYVAIRYEGFGPEGASLIIDAMTDNVNRTVSEVSVEHSYQHLSHVAYSGLSADEVLDLLILEDIDVIDIETENEETIITANGYALDAVLGVLNRPEIKIHHQDAGWFPLDTVKLSEENQKYFDKLLTMLDDVDDVSDVYHNVLMDE